MFIIALTSLIIINKNIWHLYKQSLILIILERFQNIIFYSKEMFEKIQNLIQERQKNIMSQHGQIKEELLNTKVKLQKEKQKYAELLHKQEYHIKQIHLQNVLAKFTENQWMKSLQNNNKQVLIELQALRQQVRSKQTIIRQLKNQKEDYIKTKNHTIKMQEQKIQALKIKNKQIGIKLDEKNNTCKVMMAKIFSLEKQIRNLGVQLKKMKERQTNRLKQYNLMKDQSIQIDCIESGNIFTDDIQRKLRDQILNEFFSTFLKSFEVNRNQPNIQIFRLNLECINMQRMKPYCQCFINFLKLHEAESLEINNLSDKQKWLVDSLNCLRSQKINSKDQNSKLVYLFRLSSLYYRIYNPMEGKRLNIRQSLIKDIKDQLFNAFHQYLLSQ